MRACSQESGVNLPACRKQSTPLVGDGLLRDKECLESWRDEEGDVVKASGQSFLPLRLYQNHGRRQRPFKTQCVLFIISLISLALFYTVTPFRIPVLPWLGTSSQHLCTCIYQTLHSTQMYNDSLSRSSGSVPNITRTFFMRLVAVFLLTDNCSCSFRVPATRVALYKAFGMAKR